MNHTLVYCTSALALLAAACSSANSNGSAEPAPGAPRIDMGGCTRAAVIDDSEDNDHRLLTQGERGGYVYTFLDEAGSSVEPLAGRLGGTFAQSEGGANGSMYAARFHGKTSGGAIVFAGFGLNFTDPKTPYDAQAYEGISFFARRGADSVSSLRVKVPDTATDAEGGRCTECFNDFGTDVELTEDWQQHTLSFQDLSQLPGWGSPRPGSVDSAALYGIQFQVNSPGSSFDVWIDDVSFYGCSQP